MRAKRCLKCKYHEDFYAAPLGKLARNPHGSEGTAPVYDKCFACDGTGYIPTVILDSILRHTRGDEKRAEEIAASLRWQGDHYSFDCAGMYVGIELDGYMHT